jgi:hypothetical protein
VPEAEDAQLLANGQHESCAHLIAFLPS